MKKLRKMNEAAWLLGIILCALGVALCTKANFGLSMVAAPPYILHLFFVSRFPWYSQGTSEYIWQAVLLVGICIAVRRFTPKFLLSFGTAVLFGMTLDGWLFVLGGSGAYTSLALRIFALVFGELLTALAIAFYFRTDMPLQIYELLVTELCRRFGWEQSRVKQISDLSMLVFAVGLAFFLNHSWQGVGIGTVLITLVNAPLIALFGKLLDRFCDFSPRFPKLIAKIRV